MSRLGGASSAAGVPVRHRGTEVRSGQAGTDGGEPVDGERTATTTRAQGEQRGKEPGEGECQRPSARYVKIKPSLRRFL